jgi:hypothetical protein
MENGNDKNKKNDNFNINEAVKWKLLIRKKILNVDCEVKNIKMTFWWFDDFNLWHV